MEDTKTITTPVEKHEVVLKTALSGYDERAIKKPIMKYAKFGMRGDEPFIKDWNMGEAMEESEDIAIKTVVVSVDGEKEDVVKKVLSMNRKDYSFVIKKINEITEGENFPKPASTQ